jgi:hypothetical protein
MTNPRSNRVTFAYVGRLQSRGRLLKQLATLQEAGVTCDVVLGNTDSNEPAQGDYPFPVVALPINQESGRLTSFFNQMRFAREAAKVIAAGPADTVVCVSIEAVMAGVLAKRRRPQLRLVFDNNELQIESFESRMKRAIWRPIHNYAVRRCDVIIHAESNRMAYFKEHYPGKDKPQLVIENFPFLVAERAEGMVVGDQIRVIYLGGFGAGRYTFEIIDAFASLKSGICLDIVGFGSSAFVTEVEKRIDRVGGGRIRVLPPVPYLQVGKLLRDYHIGLAFYRNTDLNNFYCAPNKVYDYLMNGMPVISNAYPGLIQVLEAHEVGVCLEEVDAPSLDAAIDKIVKQRLWENITPAIRERYSWEGQRAKYLAVFGH